MFKNLSAYQEISIQKDTSLRNYEDILNIISNSVAQKNIKEYINQNIYNINFSSNNVSFEIDIEMLSKDLFAQNINFNLILLECSLRKNFFSLNSNISDCPQFNQKIFDKKKYLYLTYKNLSYRLGVNNPQKNLREVWHNFLLVSDNSFRTKLAPDKYLKTKNYLGYSPKITSYNNRNLEIEIKSFYNEQQFHFLINFF
ncbi:hypothetical protein N9M32_02455 [Alphaproteobacteria bacterium]|nr:hypothetical protein [Alphaproteobacteria bacterium]